MNFARLGGTGYESEKRLTVLVQEVLDEGRVLLVVPVRDHDGVVAIVGRGFGDERVDNERSSETVDVLPIVVTVNPVCARLQVGGNVIREGLSGRNGTSKK